MRILLLALLAALPAQGQERLELRLTLVLFAGGAWLLWRARPAGSDGAA